jgi:hypothetical protein
MSTISKQIARALSTQRHYIPPAVRYAYPSGVRRPRSTEFLEACILHCLFAILYYLFCPYSFLILSLGWWLTKLNLVLLMGVAADV